MVGNPNTTTLPGQAHIVENYFYSETGYISNVNCTYNGSSDIYFQNITGVGGGDPNYSNSSGYVLVLQATGSLPTGAWRGFTTMAIADDCTATALAAGYNDTQYIYALAIGYYYPDLNNVQCSVDFTAASFDIAVDVLAQNISITQGVNQAQIVDIDPTRALVNNTFISLDFLSQIITTMYTSVLGDAFMVNVQAIQTRENHTWPTESDIYTAVSESLELLLDEYFGALAASQIMLYNHSTPVNATMNIAAVQLGEPIYAYITFSINLAIVLLFSYEAIRTRFWRNLPAFNILDTKSAILGAMRGVVERQLPAQAQAWEGDAADRQAGLLRVELDANGTVLRLTSDAVGEAIPVLASPDLGDVPLRPIHCRHYSENSLRDSEHLLSPYMAR